jgi:hypothetical protein
MDRTGRLYVKENKPDTDGQKLHVLSQNRKK